MRLSRKTMQLVTAGDQREEPLAQKTAERQALIEKRKEQLYEAIARGFTPVGAPITLGSGSEALRFPVASTYSTREEIIQGCRAQQQFCSRQAEENAQTARMVENMGDWATSQRLWERAAHNQGLSDYFGQAAARYESATAPMTAPQPTAPQPTAPSPTQEEEEPEEALSYEENLRLAMDSYNRYKETGTVEDHELTLAYVDDMLEYYERERDSAEATMSNMPLVGLMSWTYKDKKVWDYVEAAGDDPDPTELARIIEEALPGETSISQSPALDYLNRSVEQILLGNFSDENTLLGTAGQFGLSLLGYDLPMDVRDLVYDWTHLQTTPWYQTLIDTLALLPVVGAIKPVANGLETALDTFKVFDRAGNAMEATSDALKTAERAGETMDAAADAGKNADELVETGGDVVYNGSKSFGDIELKPDDLMEELASSGKKYTEEDVILVTRNSDGDLLWLEKGNDSAGLTHILQRHESQFKDIGISTEEIPQVLQEILQTEPVKTTNNKIGPSKIYTYNGQDYLVAYGTNGYIVSFYPYTVR